MCPSKSCSLIANPYCITRTLSWLVLKATIAVNVIVWTNSPPTTSNASFRSNDLPAYCIEVASAIVLLCLRYISACSLVFIAQRQQISTRDATIAYHYLLMKRARSALFRFFDLNPCSASSFDICSLKLLYRYVRDSVEHR